MAYVKTTFLDCRQSLADKHDSGVLPSDAQSLSFWNRLLNRAKDYAVEYIRLTKTVPLTTVSGSVALPDEHIFIDSIFNSSNIELVLVPSDAVDEQAGYVYWVTGNEIDGHTLHTTTDETFSVTYTYRVGDMVNDSDICIIPNEEIISLIAYSKLRKSETDPLGDADSSMAEAIRLLNEYVDQRQLNDRALGFELQV